MVGGVIDDIHRRRAIGFHRTGAADVDVGALQIDIGTGCIDVVDQQHVVAIADGLTWIEPTIQRLELANGQAGVTNPQVGAAIETIADGDLDVICSTRNHLAVDQYIADDRTFGR